MDKETATLRESILAFEKQLTEAGSPRRAGKVTPTSKTAADIAEVEKMLQACGEPGMVMMDEEESVGMGYMDLDDDDFLIDDEDYDDDDDYDDEDGMYASEADPSGIEEEITDDGFSEVERLTRDTDIADAEHTFDVAETGLSHTAGLKQASARLDKLATYIEKQVEAGENKQWLKVALRIDQMTDSIDRRIKAAEEA